MLIAYIKMHKFIGAEIEEREVFGKLRKCISIPLDLNGIVEGKKSVLLKLFLIAMKPNKNNSSHYLRVIYKDLDMLSCIRRLGYEDCVKYIGNVYVIGPNNPMYMEGETEDLDTVLGLNEE